MICYPDVGQAMQGCWLKKMKQQKEECKGECVLAKDDDK